MNKKIIFILMSALILTSCASNASKAGSSQTKVSTQSQLAIGTLQLEETDYPISASQAQELLPMWYVLQELNESDAAAQEEIDGLVDQIQNTLTSDQAKAIKAMNISQKDVMTVVQAGTTSNSSSGSSQSGSTSGGGGGGFGAPPDMGAGIPGGGAPGVAPSGGISSSGNASQSSTQAVTINNAPSAVIDTVITLLKKKAEG